MAETCGAREEGPSSNLGRVKQVEATGADWPEVHDPRAHALPRSLERQEQVLWRGGIEDAPKLTTLSESEQYLTTSSSHGGIESVKVELNAYQEEKVDAHLKTLESSVDVVKPELQNDSQAADYATMVDEYLDHERKGSGRHRSHLHDSETVRARLAIALRRRVPSCGLS